MYYSKHTLTIFIEKKKNLNANVARKCDNTVQTHKNIVVTLHSTYVGEG